MGMEMAYFHNNDRGEWGVAARFTGDNYQTLAVITAA